jgi:hypothetical protein
MRQIHSAFHEQYHDDPHPQQDPPPRDSARNECFRLIVASARMAGVHCYPVANSDGRASTAKNCMVLNHPFFFFLCGRAIAGSAAPRTPTLWRERARDAVTRAPCQMGIHNNQRVHTEEREKETTIRMFFLFLGRGRPFPQSAKER